MHRRFHIVTLGCKVNQYESQALREAWRSAGLEETADPAAADVLLVNSCAVTARAIRDLRHRVAKLARENPYAEIVLTGCAAEACRDELGDLAGVSEIVPQKQKTDLLARFAKLATEPPRSFRVSGAERARGNLVVQDGCSHNCAYCIVPRARGGPVSRTPQEVEDEARRLLESGVHEIMLSGVNLRQYGPDLDPQRDFWDLLAHLDAALAPEWTGRAQLRLSSLDPSLLSDKGLATLAGCRLVCPHLHVSLQSGSPRVLSAMRRGHYTPEQIIRFVEKLPEIWPRFGLGVDVIVGFPGEDEADFAATVAICTNLPLSYAHVFPFSPRAGTIAASMQDDVEPSEKKRRAAALRAIAAEKKHAFLEAEALRESLVVALEAADPQCGGKGTSETYLPCLFDEPMESTLVGRLVSARPLGVRKESLLVTRVTR
ncbi:tRNA (N6-isopentenyl adenosine(37)-C2)-methylthiotransferase MiaB [Oceanidesulfovibrio indonesiensis]|uniref:tRNA (N6-isopentenyl adenosine(37)-C2)-methylthiotransferase MiaB n=1 Tax=Oceanidesulfovibrio indonesiensis TaxID=54767 RepID=A0A7M3MGR0_9BACT|nr:MiaB/RimO family radical SAM methylthiotransferase [Oceanidesulfovibrio indonesiensis]TVM18666.1 tRNA (N6-isopentenyl adenosine(37)-C2)-methylthiotransferase MiaB [Oceanidesulfovibrio indonesiensis]